MLKSSGARGYLELVTSAVTWENLKPGLEKAWEELHKSVNQAASRFKTQPKNGPFQVLYHSSGCLRIPESNTSNRTRV